MKIDIKTFLKNKKKICISIAIITVCFFIDIFTKRLAFKKIDYISEKTLGIHTHIKITSFFNIVKVLNTGVSFGMFNNIQYRQYILSTVTLLIILYIIYLLYKEKNINYIIIYSLIIAGGLGNFYDRITFGGVFDFLDFHIGEYHWPAFNFADSLICIAISLIILLDFYKKFKNHSK